MKNVSNHPRRPVLHNQDQPQPATTFTDVPPQSRRQTPRADASRMEAQSPSTLGLQFQFLSPSDLASVAATSKSLNVAVSQSPAYRSGAAARLKVAMDELEEVEVELSSELAPYRDVMARMQVLTSAAERAISAPRPWYIPNTKSRRLAMEELRSDLADNQLRYRSTEEELEMIEYGSRERMEQLRAEVATCRAELSAAISGAAVPHGQLDIADASSGQEQVPLPPSSACVFATPYVQRQRRFHSEIVPSPNRSARAHLEKLPDAVSKVITGFLAPQDLAHLTETSRTLSRDVREHVRYAETKRFQDARAAHLSWLNDRALGTVLTRVRLATRSGPCETGGGESLKASTIYQHTPFANTCIGIARARADRGEPHAVFAALNAAGRFLANPDVAFLSYEDERLLVEAALEHAATPLTAAMIHNLNAKVRHYASDNSAPGVSRDFRLKIAILESQLAEAATADLRSSTDALAPKKPERPVSYIEHFADEAFEIDGLIEMSHAFPDGAVPAVRKPRPDSNVGEAMVTFEFTRGGFLGHTYVHVFNLDRPAIDMEAPD